MEVYIYDVLNYKHDIFFQFSVLPADVLWHIIICLNIKLCSFLVMVFLLLINFRPFFYCRLAVIFQLRNFITYYFITLLLWVGIHLW